MNDVTVGVGARWGLCAGVESVGRGTAVLTRVERVDLVERERGRGVGTEAKALAAAAIVCLQLTAGGTLHHSSVIVKQETVGAKEEEWLGGRLARLVWGVDSVARATEHLAVGDLLHKAGSVGGIRSVWGTREVEWLSRRLGTAVASWVRSQWIGVSVLQRRG